MKIRVNERDLKKKAELRIVGQVFFIFLRVVDQVR